MGLFVSFISVVFQLHIVVSLSPLCQNGLRVVLSRETNVVTRHFLSNLKYTKVVEQN